MIDMTALKFALGDDFDPAGDYLVCGYNDLHLMQSKGYRQVGKIQDPSPGDNWMLVFDRRKFVDTKPSILGKFVGKP